MILFYYCSQSEGQGFYIIRRIGSKLDRNNKLLGKVWPGKSDIYHAYQATQIPYLNVDKSIAYSMSRLDVLALGELLIDFTCNGKSEQGNMELPYGLITEEMRSKTLWEDGVKDILSIYFFQ